MNCCEYHNLPAGCNQGRACPERAARFSPPLYTEDGGHSVSGPLTFPIEREEDDTPLETPESAAAPLREALVGFLVLVALAVGAFALPALLSH